MMAVAGPPATTIGIGDRVLHKRTDGRIRGKVVEIRITAERTVCRVVVDGMQGRDFDYDIRNLAHEPVVVDGEWRQDAEP